MAAKGRQITSSGLASPPAESLVMALAPFATTVRGQRIYVAARDIASANHPVVKANPDRFGPLPVRFDARPRLVEKAS